MDGLVDRERFTALRHKRPTRKGNALGRKDLQAVQSTESTAKYSVMQTRDCSHSVVGLWEASARRPKTVSEKGKLRQGSFSPLYLPTHISLYIPALLPCSYVIGHHAELQLIELVFDAVETCEYHLNIYELPIYYHKSTQNRNLQSNLSFT